MIVLEALCAGLGITGAVLVAYKRRVGFAVWIVGNTLWILYATLTGQWWFGAQYALFLATAVLGWVRWRRPGRSGDIVNLSLLRRRG